MESEGRVPNLEKAAENDDDDDDVGGRVGGGGGGVGGVWGASMQQRWGRFYDAPESHSTDPSM